MDQASSEISLIVYKRKIKSEQSDDLAFRPLTLSQNKRKALLINS